MGFWEGQLLIPPSRFSYYATPYPAVLCSEDPYGAGQRYTTLLYIWPWKRPRRKPGSLRHAAIARCETRLHFQQHLNCKQVDTTPVLTHKSALPRNFMLMPTALTLKNGREIVDHLSSGSFEDHHLHGSRHQQSQGLGSTDMKSNQSCLYSGVDHLAYLVTETICL